MDRDERLAARGDGPSVAAAGPIPSAAPPSSSGIEALAAEAMAFDGDRSEESIDVKVQKALECPCLDDLKKSPCGSQFIYAFSCYLKSTKEEKGSDCVNPFICRTASKKTKRHSSKRFWKKKKTTRKQRSLTSKFCLQHGPENPNQRDELL